MLLRPGFFLTATAALVGAVTAVSHVHKRDFTLIQSTLNNVNGLLGKIDNSINALNTTNVATDGPQLLQLGQGVPASLQGVLDQIQASQVLTVDETNGLNSARTALSNNINLTISDLVRQKPLFDSIPGLSNRIADDVQQVRNITGILLQVVASKLNPAAQGGAPPFGSSLAVFEMAITIFRGQAATNNAASTTPASPPVTGVGTLNADGSCNCAVTCPAG